METLKKISRTENIELKTLKERFEKGEVVILKNKVRRNVAPVGIGKGLKTKVNANIGTSPEKNDINFELKKLKVAVEAGTDAVMDLS
ncbi:MAG: phosphomethylpyrimidine synthase ThiC, partial [Candidatus Ratteibacteria bacterium]|nr:phosphomethylpyrimidine synthase ThiC [Candidatus Ratteibacteria bacterium]